MAYSLSKNIQIFPVTQRNVWDPLGRLTTEYNLTSILNRLLDVKGFVLTENNTSTEGGFTKKVALVIDISSTLDFNLNGYIIHLKDLNNLITSVLEEGTSLSDGTSIYAYIDLTKKPAADEDDVLDAYEKEHFKYLDGQDTASRTGATTVTKDNFDSVFDSNSNAYRGVVFTSEEPDSDIHPLQLKILEYHTLNSIEYKDNGWYIPKESQIKFRSNLKRTSISIDDGVI